MCSVRGVDLGAAPKALGAWFSRSGSWSMSSNTQKTVSGMDELDDDMVRANRFAVLRSEMTCWKCGNRTPVAAIWIDRDLSGNGYGDGPAILTYIGWLSEPAMQQLLALAPQMRMASSATADMDYLANHCAGCDALQGDHFVHGPDGPFFPQTREDFAMIEAISGSGVLSGGAGLSQSIWMSWIDGQET
jgi:hypothetical protein